MIHISDHLVDGLDWRVNAYFLAVWIRLSFSARTTLGGKAHRKLSSSPVLATYWTQTVAAELFR
ncbi:hypothetical protein QM012_004860 [Aureobasidium pullulans]|uniref:Uncharacterized protein n=1 Tax=Aureobasidium pullulans TaxID=5580 RepID=A0ABR0TVY1_AURPU